MGQQINSNYRPIPPRALVISMAALVVPVLAAFQFPVSAAHYEALLWLLALVPALLFAHYRGWRGAALAVALGMILLVAIQVMLVWRGKIVHDWGMLFGVVAADLGLAAGIGVVTESLHRDRIRAERLALTDELTKLPNRRHAGLFLETEFAAAMRGRPTAVVLFDLDRFKAFNDRWGHARGDAVLRSFGDVLRGTTRGSSLSARFGGEEFIAILSSCDADGALAFAERVFKNFEATQQEGATVTVSAGIAVYDPAMTSPDAMVQDADHALYEAKKAGRNRIRGVEVQRR